MPKRRKVTVDTADALKRRAVDAALEAAEIVAASRLKAGVPTADFVLEALKVWTTLLQAKPTLKAQPVGAWRGVADSSQAECCAG